MGRGFFPLRRLPALRYTPAYGTLTGEGGGKMGLLDRLLLMLSYKKQDAL